MEKSERKEETGLEEERGRRTWCPGALVGIGPQTVRLLKTMTGGGILIDERRGRKPVKEKSLTGLRFTLRYSATISLRNLIFEYNKNDDE